MLTKKNYITYIFYVHLVFDKDWLTDTSEKNYYEFKIILIK